MELRQLRYFVAIVEHGSLSRAALVLHVAQPALTQQLRQLEEELGTPLMHRSAQGVQSTDAGKVFYEHAQAILKQVADAKSAVTQSTTRPSGSVTLGLPHSISGALALPLLMAARASYPEITLQLTEELSGSLAEQLKSGRINLAVLFDDGQLAPFACSPLIEEELMFICRADSVWRPAADGTPATAGAGAGTGAGTGTGAGAGAGAGAGTPEAAGAVRGAAPATAGVALATALALPLILPAQRQGVRPRIDGAARAAGLALASVIEINSIAILKSALLADMGATILPVAPLQGEIDSGVLVAHPIHSPALARSVTLCASRNIPLTNAAAAVKRLVHQVTRELCQNGAWRGARLLP
jgi:LysR family nitrogen assimilation transcriptional regulator